MNDESRIRCSPKAWLTYSNARGAINSEWSSSAEATTSNLTIHPRISQLLL